MLLAPTEDWHMEDQRAFNQMVMTEFYPTVAAPEHARDGAVVLAANRTLRLMPLPAAKFCGGHTFFVQQSMEPQECFNVHVTFTEGGVHGKLWRLREAALWNLEPSGHFAGGRYLSFTPPAIPTPSPPARSLQGGEGVDAATSPDPWSTGQTLTPSSFSVCPKQAICLIPLLPLLLYYA